jgi:hypothetical protein
MIQSIPCRDDFHHFIELTLGRKKFLDRPWAARLKNGVRKIERSYEVLFISRRYCSVHFNQSPPDNPSQMEIYGSRVATNWPIQTCLVFICCCSRPFLVD